ncbi:MAG: hybrid sensor histidine kinase/response regulator [Mariprofundaceae bacterium]|nr:hybrid sensor histidine kinase/response regulator [Mariprofundaceae bacterium]
MQNEERKLIRESVRTLFFRHRLSLPGVLVMTAVLLFAYRSADQFQLAMWAMAIGLSSAVQWFCIRSYFLNPAKFDAYGWARLLALSSGTLGLLLGLSASFFLDLNNGTSVVLATLFLVAPIYGSTVFAAAYFPVHVLWSLGSTVPLAWCFIASDVTDYIVLGFGILLAGTPSALTLGWILAGEFKRSLRARFENVRLIGELRHEKERVEKISRDKSRFLAAVSHDLRQPLHALDLFLSSLKSRLTQQDEQRLLGLARHSSRALGDMLGELMDISRFDAGKISPERQIVPLGSLLRECADEMRPLAAEKGLKLRARLPRKGCVHTDPVLLKRILRNLLANAIQHTQQGGVLLGTRVRDDRVYIEVHDSGLGIGKEQLPHIFDEFYQIDNPERDREKGLGLGLAIVQRVADALGHQVSVCSQSGRGSCFSVAAPLCVVAKQCQLGISPPPPVATDIAGLFVLVVDDDRAILQGMRELLLGWGCEVLLAESEVALIGELKAQAYPCPDLLICDYRLRGGRTGLQVVRAVREYFEAEIPTLIISGDVHPDVEDIVRKNSCHWLEKPLREDDLRKILAEIAA